jgi:hypothetical protein
MVIMDHQHFKSEEEYIQYDHLRKRVKVRWAGRADI